MDVFMYQAALYCEGCADKIKANLQADDAKFDEDSDTYPQGPYADGGGEADSPQHCDDCGAFMENPLTAEGRDYVVGAITERIKNNLRGNAEVLTEWANFYDVTLSELMGA